MHLFYTPHITTSTLLPADEAAHCVRVLRLSEGDEVMLTDGVGNFYRAKITVATAKCCMVEVLETIAQAPLWQGEVHIAIAPTKNMDRMEWFAEKATEIGVDSITLLDCCYSERRTVKCERLEKIVVSAMKQSLKARKPLVYDVIAFKNFISRPFHGQKFIAHCAGTERVMLRDALQANTSALVLIGPEGDFSDNEVQLAIQNGFTPISLGASRLRTETAALVACHLVNLANSR